MKQYRLIVASSVFAAMVIAATTGTKQRQDIMTLRQKTLEMERMRNRTQNQLEK